MFPSLSSTDSVSSPSSSLPAFDPQLATLLPFSVPSASDSSIPVSCSPSSTDTASLPVPDTILAIVPTVSPPLSTPSVSTKTHPMLTRSKNGIFKSKAYAVQADYAVTEPPSYAVASKFSHWVAAMDLEFASLQQQHTWSLVPLPYGENVVGCKWVFKIKRDSSGNIARYKARLVAKGCLQQYGLDYEEILVLL